MKYKVGNKIFKNIVYKIHLEDQKIILFLSDREITCEVKDIDLIDIFPYFYYYRVSEK